MEEPKATRAPVIPQEDASSPFLKIPGVSRLVTLWRSNSQSLLSEIHRLQSLLDGMTQKVSLLIAQLREKEALLAEKESRIKELERQIKKNSQNSSKPPSSDGVRKPAPKSLRTPSGKKPGGQPGHKGDTLLAVETPDTVVNLPVTRCSCGEDLSLLPVTEHERRQVFDLPLPRLEVTEYCLDKVCCPACQKVIVAPAPPDVTAPTQYGLRFLSYLAYLHQDQGIPLGRVCQISSDLFGAVVSEGTILQACQRLDQQLAPFVDHTRELLKISPVVHVDETSLRVDGRNAWCHVASTPRLTLLALHEKRGREGIDALGVAPHVTGTLVSDFWGAYLSLSPKHAFCNAHILRELKAISEFDRHRWASERKRRPPAPPQPARSNDRRSSDASRPSFPGHGSRPAGLFPEKAEDESKPLPHRISSVASKNTPARSSPLPSTPPSPSPTTRPNRTSG